MVQLVACKPVSNTAHSKSIHFESAYLRSQYFNYYTIGVTSVYVKNYKAYITTTDGVEIYDIRNPRNPRKLGSFASPVANDIKVVGEYGFIVGGRMHEADGYFKILNISAPNNIRVTGKKKLSHGSVGLEVSGNYAYVSGLDAGLFIVDVSKKSAPKLVRTIEFPRRDNPKPIAKLGRAIAKIRKREQPKKFPFQLGRTWYTDLKGNLLYVNDENTGLHILDISDRKNPKPLGEFIHKFMEGTNNLAHDAFNDITVKNNIGYVTLDNGGLVIVDVKNKNRPTQLSHFNPWKKYDWGSSPGHMVKVEVLDNIAYVAAGKEGLYLIDVKNPRKPSLIEKIAVRDDVGVSWGVYIKNDLVFVTYIAADPGGKRKGKVLKGGWEIFKVVGRRP
jgi:hypothetical protein